MNYFREVATVLAKEQRSLTWKTPDGCLVEQKYVVLKDTSAHLRQLDETTTASNKQNTTFKNGGRCGA